MTAFSNYYHNNNVLPFSCDEARQKLLLAALESHRRRPTSETGSEREPKLEMDGVDAAGAAV